MSFVDLSAPTGRFYWIRIRRDSNNNFWKFSGAGANAYAAGGSPRSEYVAALTESAGLYSLASVPTGFSAATTPGERIIAEVLRSNTSAFTDAEWSQIPASSTVCIWDGGALVSEAAYHGSLLSGRLTSARAGYLENLSAGAVPTLTQIRSDVERTGGPLALIKVITDRLATMIEQIGTSGVWRFLQSAFPAAPPGYGGAVSAAFALHLAGATTAGGCGCKAKGACGCSSEAEATLYEGDTKNRIFFLLDPGSAVVALPAGVQVEIWDEDAKRGDATVTVTDPARWSGTLAIPDAVWNDAETPLQPGGYWLRVLDGDGQIVTVQPLTVLDPGQAR